MDTSRVCGTVTMAQTDERYACVGGESLLAGMAKLGRRGIPVGCLNGGCGVCKVRVLRGAVRKLGPISRAHVSADEEDQGYALACRVAPDGDVELEVAGRLKKPFFCGAACADAPVFKK
ncbi:TPA: 2Fe-2S iron-sulfur cluster binding domain-containing protein [Burkholderia multivorans]|uniref:2Fe-2S iron-sulfur cluster-binding protein n=1 Tax=Burkholderia multivorans TaxID=87883 RepID=UPI000D0002AB|nr:2Fe-2S iron-sulfur cluster-binding protein [Burkholderia multivorans]MBU9295789.1 2Fe-2S iron-sulfur cluster binding domain-containing protein [Burkholderia multivorans]MBU9302072.1 2Fe-2S iron-sulfur cluster binding domain-containing protein [Burkholderia multivorans]MBU9404947.1 2Fe-2S iron-sulfur cluster binding domain-containing protein [Burkholderia multivorans]MBU9499985.1 2Fe-2S iron-sulfur cluster binding domain-containing protein [Burkholderia multivorans]MBU9505256.1 2Fe-2S iron-s